MTSIDELDERMAEEILATPVPVLEAELERAKVRRGDPALRYPAAAAHFGVEPVQPDPVPPVERPARVSDIFARLREAPCVMVVGAAGSGKTALLHETLEAALRSSIFNRALALDGTSMRFEDPVLLSRAALAALDEPFATLPSGRELRRRLAAAPFGDDATVTLKRYLETAIGPDVVVVLDHVDHLVDHRGSLKWLRRFVATVAKAGGRVLMASRGTPFGGRRGQLPRGGAYSRSAELAAAVDADIVQLDDFDLDELGHWLRRPFFDQFRVRGLTPRAIHRISGGRPALVMDLVRHLSRAPGSAPDALRDYARRAAGSFHAEVAGLLEALRGAPRYMIEPLAAPAALHHQMVETGGVRRLAGGRLVFSSPVIGRRYRAIATPNELLWMVASGAPTLLVDRPAEVIGEALRGMLRDLQPRSSFSQFADMLARRGLGKPCVFAGDRDNANLWSQIVPLRSPEALPLDDRCAGFVSAVRTGKWHLAADRALHMPVLGLTGKVELVVAGELGAGSSALSELVALRELCYLTDAAAPALASAFELQSARRSLRLQRKLYHRLQHEGAGRGNPHLSAAQTADCSAVAVIERGLKSWVVSNLDIVDTSEDSEQNWRTMLAHPKGASLTEIASHQSGRGVVLTEERMRYVFPKIHHKKEDYAAFIFPVRNGDTCRLVTYLFEGAASRDINGSKQVELSTFAPFAATG